MTDRECHQDSIANQQRQAVHYWLALKLVPRLAVQRKLALVEQFGIESLFEQTPSQQQIELSNKQYQAIYNPDWHYIETLIEQSQQAGAEILSYSDIHYPQQLKQIFDPPLVLFVKGNAAILNHIQVAIVGSRNASIHGREIAMQLSGELSENGIVVTSGLALGIDAFAHKGVVDNQLPTIAVIATGIDIIYPARNKALAKKIIESGGAIVTEFFPGIPPKAGHFPKRNRIISGLSQGVVVIEAAMKSGSLITARCALEQNRDVFAVPGNIQNPQVKGCHWLIKQGAKLVDEVADIIEEMNVNSEYDLHLKRNNSGNKEKTQESKKSCDQDLFNDALLASVGYEITPVDTVVSRSKLPTDVVLTRLTMLELRGLVSAVPGGYLKIK